MLGLEVLALSRASRPTLEPVYRAARRFVEAALERDDSLFTPGHPVWSLDVCRDLHARFTERPDTSDDAFLAKFKRQLTGAPPATLQLAGELLFVHFLASRSVSPGKKRSLIEKVLAWSAAPVAIPDDLLPALGDGLAKPGTSFNTRRPFLLSFLLKSVIRWKELPDGTRKELEDPWKFKAFLESVPVMAAATQRNALLNLVRPDHFEPITSTGFKEQIAAAFRKRLGAVPDDLDQQLYAIRKALEPTYGPDFMFYDPELRAQWQQEKVKSHQALQPPQISASTATAPAKLDGKAWLFQCNPDLFDLSGALGASRRFPWEVNQYANQIHNGDSVFLWLTGKSGGLKAAARAIDDPKVMPDMEAVRSFWRDPARAGEARLRVMLDFNKVAPEPIPKQRVMVVAGLADLPNLRFANATNFSLTSEQARGLRLLMDETSGGSRVADGHSMRLGTDTAPTREWLGQQTLWTEEDLAELLVGADASRQLILAGPPGTGKTWVAKALAHYLAKGNTRAVQVVQFHPGYSYEQFIQGIRPTATGGAIEFKVVDGLLLKFLRETADLRSPRVVIVDEMNRANLPKVLGELLYLLEYRDETVQLQYSGAFAMPSDLFVIGTMNTADRSTRGIDSALRRRFRVIECRPDASILSAFYRSRPNEVSDLSVGFERLNAMLNERIDRHHLVGHTFFMCAGMTKARLKQIWAQQVKPLLEEYFFDEPEVVAAFKIEELWPSVGT